MTTIEEMPFLVLKRIFDFLSVPERETCSQVCRRWEDFINFEIGQVRFIGNGAAFNFKGHKSVNWTSFCVLNETGIEKCIFGDIELPSDLANSLPPSGEPLFLLPELVKEISFYGMVTASLFHLILEPTHWLNSLRLHLSVFLSVSFDNPSWRLCNLSNLRIFYTHPIYNLQCPFISEEANSTYLGKELVHINLIKFLQIMFFRRLKEFEFIGPYFIDKMTSFIESVCAFTRKHENTMTCLTLSFPYEWSVEKTATTAGERAACNRTNSFKERKQWGNVQLKKLLIACPVTVVPPIHLTIHDEEDDSVYPRQTTQEVSIWSQKILNPVWQSLLEKQLNMEVVQYLNKYEDWPFPQAVFGNNSFHLRNVSLCVNAQIHVDCTALRDCVNLRKFALEGNNFLFNEEKQNEEVHMPDTEGIKHLSNLHLLPRSIEEISFTKLLIPCTELELLLEDSDGENPFHPCLNALQLYQISKELSPFGLSIRAIQYLLKRSHISFSFWQALNAPSFQETLKTFCYHDIDRNQKHEDDEEEDDDDMMTLKKLLEFADPDERLEEADLLFSNLNDCLFKRIVKK